MTNGFVSCAKSPRRTLARAVVATTFPLVDEGDGALAAVACGTATDCGSIARMGGPSKPEARVIVALPQFTAGHWRDFYVEIFRGRLDTEVVKLSRDSQLDAVRTTGRQRFAGLSVFHENVGIPDADTRRLADEALVRVEPHTRAGVMARLATGFTASLFRSLFTAATLGQGSKYAKKVTSTVRDGCEFLLVHVEQPASVNDLLEVYRQLDVAQLAAT